MAIDCARASPVIEMYSFLTKEWTRFDNVCDDRERYGAEIVDGKLFLIGGQGVNGVVLNTVITTVNGLCILQT